MYSTAPADWAKKGRGSGVMVNFIENGHGNSSSITGLGDLHFNYN